MKILIATTLLALCSIANAQGQSGTAGSQAAPADAKQKGMMKGGMSGMMEHCQMHCRESMTAMTTLSKQVEEARQSNDVNKMRAALDAVAKHHSEMRHHRALRAEVISTPIPNRLRRSSFRAGRNERELRVVKPAADPVGSSPFTLPTLAAFANHPGKVALVNLRASWASTDRK
jgi:hypothetical protein